MAKKEVKIDVIIDGKKKKIKCSCKKVKELLEFLKLNREDFLILKNGRLCTESEEIGKDDKIEFLSVISGG